MPKIYKKWLVTIGNNFKKNYLNMFLFNNISYKAFSHFSLLKNHYYHSIL